jgi:ubiquinone/menaquinone biosynthesis C-methylase UbiE
MRSMIISGLGLLRQLELLLVPSSQRRQTESGHWEKVNLDQARRVSWDSIQCLGLMAVSEMTGGRWEQLMDVIIHTIAPPDPNHLRGLTLGCGDMACEHWFFIHPALPFALVDAYEISAEMVRRARQRTDAAGLNVEYHLKDVNYIALPPDMYDLVVVAHSLHHFKRIDHVIDQINRSLKPGGLFVAWEYVGPRYQRFSRRQRAHANMVLHSLPTKYRRELDGSIRKRAKSQSLLLISPDEAVRSDRILPALKQMNILYQYNWAGLLFPLLRGGIAANFDQNDPDDRKVIDCLFQLDRLLCQSGQVEPSFTVTIAAKDTDRRDLPPGG